jgi:hypothetical protein
MPDLSPTEKPLTCTARSPARTLDVAKGVLVALRRCDADEMFMELVEVSRKYALSTFTVAAALVAAVDGRPDVRGDRSAAANAVEFEWGSLLTAMSATDGRRYLGG